MPKVATTTARLATIIATAGRGPRHPADREPSGRLPVGAGLSAIVLRREQPEPRLFEPATPATAGTSIEMGME